MNLVQDGIVTKRDAIERARQRARDRAKASAYQQDDPTRVASTSSAIIDAGEGQSAVRGSIAHQMTRPDPSSVEAESPRSAFSSSDFEVISESEARNSGKGSTIMRPAASSRRRRSSSRGRARAKSPQQASRATFTLSPDKDVDGDDEQSAVEAEEESRGRARTRERRRREDDARFESGAVRNKVEDALRSSLALLMSMSPVPQSLSPAMSHLNMQSLAAASATRSPAKTPASPAHAEAFSKMHGYAPSKPSPFASALTSALANSIIVTDQEDVRDDVDEGDSIMEATIDSSSDEGTELGPREPYGSKTRPVPIPRAQRGRSNSDAAAASSSTNVSPLIHSRHLPLHPSSASPPTWSRKRVRRGKHRVNSISPGPASIEERRKARSHLTDSMSASSFDVVQSSDAPPALSRRNTASQAQTGQMSFSSLGLEGPSLLDDRYKQDEASSAQASSEEASSSLPSDEPRLASSVPTLELSSGPEQTSPDRIATSSSATRRRAGGGKKAVDADSSSSERIRARARAKDKQARWWWWRLPTALSNWLDTFELRVWHVVGFAGLLLGVGIAAGPLVKAGKGWAAKSAWPIKWSAT